MPSVRDKAFRLSSRPYKAFNHSKLSTGTSHLRKWIVSCFQPESHRTNRLGKGQPDMPMAGEDQTPRPNKQPSSELKHSPGHSLADKSTDIVSKRCDRSHPNAEDFGGERGISSISNKPKPSIPTRRSQGEDKCDGTPQVTLSPGRKPTISSSEYLDQQVSQHLRRRKAEIVHSLMATILECLDNKLAPFEEPFDGDGSPPRPQGSGGRRIADTFQTSTGRKRHLQGDDEDHAGEEGEDNNGRDRISKRPRIKTDDGYVKYACPYYKFDPERFKNCRTCCGPGWKDVHRVKEHLGRCHRLPQYQCNRCCELFEKEDELKKHQRVVEPCPVREKTTERNLADGFDQEQEQKFQKRSKKPGHAKWTGWYCILFNVEPGSPDIPSPYHGVFDSSGARTSSDYGSYKQYCDYLRQELPPLIRTQVEVEVDKALLGAEDEIRNNVLGAIQGIPRMLYRIFQTIPPPPGVAASEGDENQDGANPDEGIPLGFDPDDIFSNLEFNSEDAFDFNAVDREEFELQPALGDESLFAEFSASSLASDTICAAGSSDTSVGEVDAPLAPPLDPVMKDWEELSEQHGYVMPQSTEYPVA